MSLRAATWTRRSLLRAGAGGLVFAARPAQAAPSRVAVVDWALLETILALGAPPLAAVELVLFRKLAVEPEVPPEVVDLGLRGAINFELLAALSPDLIYRSDFGAWAHHLLARIAPVRDLTIFREGERPFALAESAMRAMSADLGLSGRAEAYIGETHAEIAALAAAIAGRSGRPVLVVDIGDARHFRAFGDDSMFGDVVARMGFSNAWGPRTRYSATAPVGIEAMADFPDAIVVVIGPIPPDARRVLPESALWKAMPAVRDGRVATLDPINPFGGLPAARRFARAFAAAVMGLS